MPPLPPASEGLARALQIKIRWRQISLLRESCFPSAFRGVLRLRSTTTTAETVKTSSSKWIKTKGAPFVGFHWQAGYGAFSVSQSEAETVVTYIKDQARHHQKMTFQEKYRPFWNAIRSPVARYGLGLRLCTGPSGRESLLDSSPRPLAFAERSATSLSGFFASCNCQVISGF